MAALRGLDIGEAAGGGAAGGIGEDGAEEAGLGLLGQALGQEQGAQVGVGRGRAGIGLRGAADQLDGLRRAPLRGAQDAEVVQGQGMVGPDLERGFVELARAVDLAAAVARQRLLEHRFDIAGGFGVGSLEGKGGGRHDGSWTKAAGP